MRTMEWRPGKAETPAKRWHYALLIEDIELGGFQCESYGLCVRDLKTGEETTARHIKVNGPEALALLDAVARLEVSPVTLRDVVEDYLGQ